MTILRPRLLKAETVTISGMAVDLEVQILEQGTCSVVVALSREGGLEPLKASTVAVDLYDANADIVDLIEAPDGLLPEFGGGLGITINARFCFQIADAPPVRAVVAVLDERESIRIFEQQNP